MKVAPNVLEAENARLAEENATLKKELAAARQESPSKYSRKEGRRSSMAQLSALQTSGDDQTQKYIRSQARAALSSP